MPLQVLSLQEKSHFGNLLDKVWEYCISATENILKFAKQNEGVLVPKGTCVLINKAPVSYICITGKIARLIFQRFSAL